MSSGVPAHLQRLGLSRNPFPPTPDAQAWHPTPVLERQRAEVAHCLTAGKGFVLLTGEVGTGKSTFLRALLADLERSHGDRVAVSMVFNTFLQGGELLAAILRDFGLTPANDPAADLDRLNTFLIERHRAGVTCVLVIDDAQNLGVDSLELLRLLSNLETSQHKLLQLLLAGQPELRALLARHEIRQLASRIVSDVRLAPLSRAQLERYVRHRLRHAGAGETILLTAAASWRLHRASGGNPRRAHLLLDRCLYGLIVRGDRRIDLRLVQAAAGELAELAPPRRWSRLAVASIAAAALVASTLWPEPLRRAEALATAAPVRQAAEVAGHPLPTTGTSPAFADCIAEQTRHGFDVARVPSRIGDAVRGRALCLRDDGDTLLVAWPSSLALDGSDAVSAIGALQQRLHAAGFYSDAVDGVFGRRTQAALQAFQRQQGLAPTGLPDVATLLLADAMLPPRTPAAESDGESHADH